MALRPCWRLRRVFLPYFFGQIVVAGDDVSGEDARALEALVYVAGARAKSAREVAYAVCGKVEVRCIHT